MGLQKDNWTYLLSWLFFYTIEPAIFTYNAREAFGYFNVLLL